MNTPLDNAITAAAAAEAVYQGDVDNLALIQAAIDQAVAPLGPATQKQIVDAAAFNTALDQLSTAALAAKILPPPIDPPQVG